MFSHPINEHLQLQLLLPHHAEPLFALIDANRAHIHPWLPWVDSTQAVNDTRAFITRSLKQFGDFDGAQFGIFYAGQIAGCIGMHYFDFQDRDTEIGYWLGAAFTGRGIMTAAVATLTGFALRELGLNRVEIRAAVGNRKSRAVPERLGFTLEGILRSATSLYGTRHDMAVYSMLAEEWR